MKSKLASLAPPIGMIIRSHATLSAAVVTSGGSNTFGRSNIGGADGCDTIVKRGGR